MARKVFGVLLIVTLFFAPAGIALFRRCKQDGLLCILNLMLPILLTGAFGLHWAAAVLPLKVLAVFAPVES